MQCNEHQSGEHSKGDKQRITPYRPSLPPKRPCQPVTGLWENPRLKHRIEPSAIKAESGRLDQDLSQRIADGIQPWTARPSARRNLVQMPSSLPATPHL